MFEDYSYNDYSEFAKLTKEYNNLHDELTRLTRLSGNDTEIQRLMGVFHSLAAPNAEQRWKEIQHGNSPKRKWMYWAGSQKSNGFPNFNANFQANLEEKYKLILKLPLSQSQINNRMMAVVQMFLAKRYPHSSEPKFVEEMKAKINVSTKPRVKGVLVSILVYKILLDYAKKRIQKEIPINSNDIQNLIMQFANLTQSHDQL